MYVKIFNARPQRCKGTQSKAISLVLKKIILAYIVNYVPPYLLRKIKGRS